MRAVLRIGAAARIGAVVVEGAAERVLARRWVAGAFALRARAPARRAAHVEAGRLGLVAGAAHLIGIGLVQVHAGQLRGIESHEPRVGVHHVARVPARRHAREVVLLDGAQDVGADAQAPGRRREVEAAPLACLAQYRSETHLCRHVVTPQIRTRLPPHRALRTPSASPTPWRRPGPRAACCRSGDPRRPSTPTGPLYALPANSPP